MQVLEFFRPSDHHGVGEVRTSENGGPHNVGERCPKTKNDHHGLSGRPLSLFGRVLFILTPRPCLPLAIRDDFLEGNRVPELSQVNVSGVEYLDGENFRQPEGVESIRGTARVGHCG